MDIYFVRHGQTDGNVAKRHQHPNTPINEVGILQARAMAAEVQKLAPTHLISSTHIRTLLTAREISTACNLIPDTHPLFVEFCRPDFLTGERIVHKTTFQYILRWFWGLPDASMHDGESHKDFVQRIGEARQYLETLPADARVVVVSHSVFINFFLEHMCNPRPMGFVRATLRFLKIITLPNTSITHVRYHAIAGKKVCAWELVR